MSAPDVVRLSEVIPALARAHGLTEAEAGRRVALALEALADDPLPDEVWGASVEGPSPRREGTVSAADLADYFRDREGHFRLRGGRLVPTTRSLSSLPGGVTYLGPERASADAIWCSRRWVQRLLAAAGLSDPWALAGVTAWCEPTVPRGPRRPDDWHHAMDAAVRGLWAAARRHPSARETWAALAARADVATTTEAGEAALVWSPQAPQAVYPSRPRLTWAGFQRRFERYFTPTRPA